MIIRYLSEKYTWSIETISKLTLAQLRAYTRSEGEQKTGYMDHRQLMQAINERQSVMGLPKFHTPGS